MDGIDLSDRDIRQKFLQCNYTLLAAYAHQHQKKQGRGIVVIDPFAGNGGIALAYENDLKKLFSAKTIKDKIQSKVNSYNPEKEVLVGFRLSATSRINTDNCILHSLGSTTFPINTAVAIFDDIMAQFQPLESATAA